MEEPKGQGIGLGSLIAIVVSSSIGAGIFALTGNLATTASAGAAMLAWILVGVGILMLALSLSNLGLKRPDLDGIFMYADVGFGHFWGFISGWGYWLSAWFGNVAFAVVLMSAFGYFFPAFGTGNNVLSVVVASLISWFLTWLVSRGVESAAFINAVVTICKLIPLVTFIVVAIFMFKGHIFTTNFWTNMTANAASGSASLWDQVKSCLLVLMWVFVGVEGATMMSARAKRKSDASRATVIGLLCLLVIYILASMLPYGYLSQTELAKLNQPAMVYLLKDMLGPWGGALVSFGLIMSLLGAWLSWTMLPAETMRLMVRSKLLPPFFGRENRHRAPTVSLIVTAICIQVLLVSTLWAKDAYTMALSLCTAAIVVCYVFVGLYQIKFSWQHRAEKGAMIQLIIGVIATAFQIFGLAMAGMQYLLLCLIIYVPGVFFFARANHDNGAGHYLSHLEWAVALLIAGGAIFGSYLLMTGAISL